MTAAAIARVPRPNSHHWPLPDPSQRSCVLSFEDGTKSPITVPNSRSENPLTYRLASQPRIRGAPPPGGVKLVGMRCVWTVVLHQHKLIENNFEFGKNALK
ncbi:hypothetical protein AVEN_35921-1 [Araneus ventricosus]|uniref:Uncharacterized protein n=1 Tax=Araneus ventricosus TaxID=182803 RepID=A0A4Y2RWH3_ARAVE|nr:hypothetical protein AVEN_35921-1 [Araneus ventricosus]